MQEYLLAGNNNIDVSKLIFKAKVTKSGYKNTKEMDIWRQGLCWLQCLEGNRTTNFELKNPITFDMFENQYDAQYKHTKHCEQGLYLAEATSN